MERLYGIYLAQLYTELVLDKPVPFQKLAYKKREEGRGNR
jgi:hypothetical protein